ncbi:MAG: hypothetical protein P8Z37_14150 [Acidobacteriota bacterium]
MKKCIVWMSVLCLLGIYTVAIAADIDGKWESERPGRQGGAPSVTTYTFKADGSKLTGTISGGRGGDVEITDGKIEGNEFSFTVVRSFNGNEMKQNYKGTISGDELTMTMEMEGGFGGGAPGGGPGGGMGAPPGGGAGGPGGAPGGGRGPGPRNIVAKRVK